VKKMFTAGAEIVLSRKITYLRIVITTIDRKYFREKNMEKNYNEKKKYLVKL